MARNGRLVVAVVLTIGVGLGALGSWFLVRSRPVPGDFVDAVATPDGGAVAIRHQRGSERYFVDVYGPDRLRWRALVPPYAGAVGTPAVAATAKVVTVRVVRDGHPHLFAFDTLHGAKIASFDLADDTPADAHAYTLPGLATVAADGWAVEVLARPGGGARLIAVALDQRRLAWKVDLAAPPTAVWLTADQVVARTGDALAAWRHDTGVPEAARTTAPPAPTTTAGLQVTPGGFAAASGATYPVPADAARPEPYHVSGGRAWVIEPAQLTVLDATLAPARRIGR
ncbi:MAG: hypothetical protein R3B06_15070 [Kofleriaceae bacterium]